MAQKIAGCDGGTEEEELLVFGYACKLFRDDDKAQMIDSGQHLIPWMGDDTLKIDRYDGRGALYDLASHEPDPTKWEQLTFEELEMERMCDKERYRSLNSAVEEETVYHEEEIKRFYQQTNAYGQVAYIYEEKAIPIEEESQSAEDLAPAEPFVPPSGLAVPQDMVVPETMKLHAIIERTALFISQQGPQMEIIMKLKQHGNKQFDFLSHNDVLHPYYKYLLSSIKTGTYVPYAEEKAWLEEEQTDETEYDHYLHPSLAAKPLKIVNNEENPQDSQAVKSETEEVKLLPENIKKIIETMVRYVAKNGPAFETLIHKRGEARFSFLNPSDSFNYYYKDLLKGACKSDKWDTEKKPKVVEPKEEMSENDDNDSNSSKSSSKGLKRKPNPVCFSIKKAKENEGLEVPSALPVEDSSDENEFESINSPKQVELTKESSLDSSDDSELSITDKKKKKRRARRKGGFLREKDIHIQKERKMKVAQFLRGLKSKQS